MTKSGTDRSDKYAAKFDPSAVQLRYTATAELAKAKQVIMQQFLADKNAAVRAVLNEAGILPIDTVKYQSFNNKLFAICNKFAGLTTSQTLSATATAQASIVAETWKTGYSATVEVLKSIWNLYSAMLGTAPSPFP